MLPLKPVVFPSTFVAFVIGTIHRYCWRSHRAAERPANIPWRCPGLVLDETAGKAGSWTQPTFYYMHRYIMMYSSTYRHRASCDAVGLSNQHIERGVVLPFCGQVEYLTGIKAVVRYEPLEERRFTVPQRRLMGKTSVAEGSLDDAVMLTGAQP